MQLNDQEIQALTQLLDLALRANGLAALDMAAHFRGRIAEHKAAQEKAANALREAGVAPVAEAAE